MQMVDGDEREPAAPGDRLRRREPDEERADQARPLRDRDPVDPAQRHTGDVERLAHDRRDQLEVATRGDLGDDAAEAGVQLGLGGDDVRADLAVLGDDRRGGLVAGRLQPEDHAAPAESRTAGSRHMISASSRLSV